VPAGFLARGGIALGPAAVSFGYGAPLNDVTFRAALVFLSDTAMTEILVALEATGDAEDSPLALVTLSDEPKVDVRTTHAPLTVVEIVEET
jgi:hypothetical protein